jgi:hypothetical protein
MKKMPSKSKYARAIASGIQELSEELDALSRQMEEQRELFYDIKEMLEDRAMLCIPNEAGTALPNA